ncbi:cob(I)yrinic acid a,c-diamide adenosyltransferase [Pendulispora albinea]|uniref:corrinoid adenosyltransferase n=1 Tax=Pendulispora albinea TaxID=2741071 RepID=A0ABZ2LX01_9BACT
MSTNDASDAAEAGEAEKAGAPAPKARGLLVVYTGHGKGKTTAALGMVFRALGRGLRVTVVQFIKGKWKTGERIFAETLPGLQFHVMGLGFTWDSDDLGKDKAAARAAWETARAAIASGERDLIVLDELTYTFHYDFISEDEVLEALRARPAHVHVVITGRNAPEALTEAADLVTEMVAVKHPFAAGVKAQVGVDF